jgi:ubiquinone/menaquinone biosynthesis C-methylase UbiE
MKAGAGIDYELGHMSRELERLDEQAQIVAPITLQLFREAGIAQGMRVLDIGSGAGHVAFLAAELVGTTGEVIGTDRAAAAVTAAQAHAKSRTLHQVSFREGDPAEMTFERPFDAVVGRYVLMFQTDPAIMLRKVRRHLRPGGVIAFHESHLTSAHSVPPASIYDRCNQWINETFKRLGTETQMGAKLYAAFVAAGLPAPTMRASSIIGGGDGASRWLHHTAELARTLLPEIERMGVATAAEVDIETLYERLRREVGSARSVIIGRSEIGAWSLV